MSREKSSRSRRGSKHSARVVDTKNQDSEYSFDSEPSDRPKNTSTPVKRDRTYSGSSVKSSRRQRGIKNSDESVNEIDAEDLTYTKYEDSGSNEKNVYSDDVVDSVRKVEDYLTSDHTRSNENRESESPEDNRGKREKRRKSKKQRREKNRGDSDKINDQDDDEEGRSEGRDPQRSRSRKSRTNVNRKSRRKRRASRAESTERVGREDERELPITEILRKAQENPKPRHEEPLPLAKLTSDRIYVQRRNGFSVVKISADRINNGIFARRNSQKQMTHLLPIKVAIVAQKIWNSTGFIHQGLLAGIALMHFLLMQTIFRVSLDFLIDYSLVSEYYTNIFSYLVTMSVVSAFDRFDLAQLDIDHYREIYMEHSKSFLSIPIYTATFLLHQTSLLVDDNISLMNYPRNLTGFENNSSSITMEENLVTWHKVSLAKDSLAVLAWLFVALGPHEDMLLTYLRAMKKYVEPVDTSG